MTPGPKPTLSGTDLIHVRDHLVSRRKSEVAPSISVTTTFRKQDPSVFPDSAASSGVDYWNPNSHVYSRYTQENVTVLEHILSQANKGYALTYSSGLSASYAALLHYKPKRIAICRGYHGFYATIDIYKIQGGDKFEIIDLDDDFAEGDFCWLETPLNPTGESRNIKYYADKVHAVGGRLVVDSTFAPPPLQYPFDFGADMVVHSGSKYFGGHSDLLCGIIVVKTLKHWRELHHDRTHLGHVMGSLESWLLLRSLKTLHLRVPRQSENSTAIVQWLNKAALTPKGSNFDELPGGVIQKVLHSSLQRKDTHGFDPSAQMPGGWNPTFSIIMATKEQAAALPHTLKLFTAATSLGSVESLMEHRAGADPGVDEKLVRVSIGVEDLEDLKEDLRAGLWKILDPKAKL